MSEDGSSSEVGRKKPAKLPSLTSYEKDLLLQIVSKPAIKSVVENKSTNLIWTAQKVKAWEKVSTEFCADIAVVKRSGPQLKKAWENLKSRTKKQISRRKRATGKTGGGSKENSLSPTSYRVVSIIPSQMVSLNNDYDDDGNQYHSEKINEDELELHIATSSTAAVVHKFKDNMSPEEMCSKSKSRPIKTSNPKRKLLAGQEIIVLMEEELQVKKLKLLDLQIEREEHNMLMEKEYHNSRMELIKLQIISVNGIQIIET